MKAQLLLNFKFCLSNLFPNGTFHGDEFHIGNIYGDRAQSLRVALTGEKMDSGRILHLEKKGDVIGIWAAAQGKDVKRDFFEAMAEISEWVGYDKKCPAI